MVREGVFVEHRFGLGLNRGLDGFEVCRFMKNRIFDNSGHIICRYGGLFIEVHGSVLL